MTNVSFNVQINDDNILENDEKFELIIDIDLIYNNITSISNNAVVTIIDTDCELHIHIHIYDYYIV